MKSYQNEMKHAISPFPNRLLAVIRDVVLDLVLPHELGHNGLVDGIVYYATGLA
jgi:hypothetical protein